MGGGDLSRILHFPHRKPAPVFGNSAIPTIDPSSSRPLETTEKTL